jgi:hypothetical protein
MNHKTPEPPFSDLSLKEFTCNNKHVEVTIEGKYLIIDKPWGRNDARLKSEIENRDFINVINNIVFDKKYDAIFHKKENLCEFLFAFIDPDSEEYKDIADRQFTVYFNGVEHKCYFGSQSKSLDAISAAFNRLPSDISVKSVPQILPFIDAQNLDKRDERVKSYFANKVGRSFYIKLGCERSEVNFDSLCKHVNFLMGYYDRDSPTIDIKPDIEHSAGESSKPIRYVENQFPKELVVNQVDEILLKLLEVARSSGPRFAFLYSYQIFEYAGYYYIDDNAKKELRRFLKDPSLVNGGEDKVKDLFSILTEINHSDDVKMKRVIEDYCDPSVVWKEISNDLEFFSKEHELEGGVVIKPLITTGLTEDAWSTMWMPKLYDQLTRIRNSLVHAREKRESKAILPTRKNNAFLGRYVPLIQRVAEQVALRYE